MAGQGRKLGGLAPCLLGVLGVSLTCGLPMWHETSFVGANIVTFQSAGRALTIISIIAGFLGFMVTLFGGGVVNCGHPPEPNLTNRNNSKVFILGGALCFLSGVLCLVSVIWSAAITTTVANDPLVMQNLKRDVGSSVYIGLASSLLLLLAGVLIGLVCWDKEQ